MLTVKETCKFFHWRRNLCKKIFVSEITRVTDGFHPVMRNAFLCFYGAMYLLLGFYIFHEMHEFGLPHPVDIIPCCLLSLRYYSEVSFDILKSGCV